MRDEEAVKNLAEGGEWFGTWIRERVWNTNTDDDDDDDGSYHWERTFSVLGRMLSKSLITTTAMHTTALRWAPLMSTVANTLHVLTHSVTPQPTEVRAIFYTWEDRGTERLNYFSEVTKTEATEPGLELGWSIRIFFFCALLTPWFLICFMLEFLKYFNTNWIAN